MQVVPKTITNIKPLIDAIFADALNDQEWPDEAMFMVSYQKACWPCSIDILDTPIKKYFASRQALTQWLEEQKLWAQLEGNRMEFSVWEWDLGPQFSYSNWF